MKSSKKFEKVLKKGKEKYLVLEVGNYNTKMIEVESVTGKVIVNKGFIISTPEGTLDDDIVVKPDELVKELKIKIIEEKITSRMVTISLSSKDIITREMVIPKMNGKDMLSFIKVNSKDIFPVSLEDYTLGYVSMSKEEKSKLLIIAIPNEIIVPYIDITQKLGLILRTVNFSGFELYNLIDFELGKNAGTYAVVDLGSKNTNFVIISRGNLMYNRIIKSGSDDVTQAIADKFKCTLTKAEKIKRDYNSVITEGSLKPTDEVYIVAEIFKDVLSGILSDIANLLEFYNSNHSKSPVNKIYIIGLATKISGISEYTQSVLGVETEKIKEFERVIFEDKAKTLKRRQVTIENCLGAVPIDEKRVIMIKGKLQLYKGNQVLKSLLYKICMAIGLLIIATLSMIYYFTFEAKKEITDYRNMIDGLKEVVELQNTLKEKQGFREKQISWDNSIPFGIEKRLGTINKLEKANDLVPEIIINNYNFSNDDEVIISCSTPNETISYDFSSALKPYFDMPELLPFSSRPTFSLKLTDKK